MNSSKAKEIKEKLFEKMFGTGYSDSDRKILLERPNFRSAYKKAKKTYMKATAQKGRGNIPAA